MSVWVEKNRVYSDASDVERASCEIDLYARENGLELSHEYLAKSELRGEKQLYLKHILSKPVLA
ncbi:MAG: hypothetical protein ABIH23_33930 [bacterium]